MKFSFQHLITHLQTVLETSQGDLNLHLGQDGGFAVKLVELSQTVFCNWRTIYTVNIMFH